MNEMEDDCTRAVRAGLDSCAVTGAVVPPLHLSSIYAFRGFNQPRQYDYSPSGNPTRDLLGNALADLEDGAGGIITSTGMFQRFGKDFKPATGHPAARPAHTAPASGKY